MIKCERNSKGETIIEAQGNAMTQEVMVYRDGG